MKVIYMRSSFRSKCLAALLSASAVALPIASHAQTPLISGTAGSGSNTYFFVMDFRDFSAPQEYAFTYKSNSATLSFESILVGLDSVPTFNALISTGSPFGDSLDGLAYTGKTKFNDFAGSNSGEPNGFWSQWNSATGSSWTEDNSGISGQIISAGQWAGASWTSDFNTVTNAAPRVPTGADAAPEPGALVLLASGALGVIVPIARRRRRA